MRNIRVAVIGCGYWGKNLVRNCAQLHVLQWICDTDEATLQAQAQLYPRARLTSRFEDVLTDDDIQKHVYHLYVVRAQRRAELQEHLRAMGIASAIYYPVPLHLIGAYTKLRYQRGDFPEAERAAEETLALPIYPEMSDEQIAYVVAAVESVSDRIGVSVPRHQV